MAQLMALLLHRAARAPVEEGNVVPKPKPMPMPTLRMPQPCQQALPKRPAVRHARCRPC